MGIQHIAKMAEDSKVKDMSLAEFGRKELDIAEIEMPGLMNTRKEFGPSKPLKGVRIMGPLHMTIQTAVLIETLYELGADIRWCSCNIFSTQDHAAAAVVAKKTSKVFAWKGETLEEYWWCTLQALTWPSGEGPQMIVDDGGDATLLIHEGVKREAEFAKTGAVPDPASTDNEEFKCVLTIIRDTLKTDPQKWTKMAANCVGVSEETTTGVHRLYEMEKSGSLLFTAINVNDSCTKSKFDNLYGGKHSAAAMRAAGARVTVCEIDPICALQACMEGLTVAPIEDVLATADIFITTTGNKGIIMYEHMKKMKNNAIVGNIGHFDNEIDMATLEKSTTRQNIKPQCDRFIKPDGTGIIVLAEGRLLNLGCATGHPSFVMSCSFTNQAMAQLEIWANCAPGKNTGKFDKKVYILPKRLDEKVARLHVGHCGAKLTTLSKEQADYIGVPIEGPYKPEQYRY